MKRLYLLRHAQALPMEEGRDFDRPLTPKGQADAVALGKAMLKHAYVPNIILCSAAQRTRDTFEGVFQNLENSEVEARFSEHIYDASKGRLIGMLQDLGHSYDSAMIIGHNPTIYELCAFFASQGPERVMTRLSEGYAPATLTVFEFPVKDWANIAPEKSKIVDYLSPIDYNAPARPTRWT